MMKWLLRSRFFHVDHIAVTLMVVLIAFVLGLVSLNLSMFNPVQQAFEDFSMTDVYYEMQRGGTTELNDDIVLVDMTEEHDRGEIGQTLHDINACGPRVVSVDLIFQREGDDVMGNTTLLEAIGQSSNIVFSSKLIDYDQDEESFDHLVTSFFSEFGDYRFAYGNVVQDHAGAVIREYSLSQKLQGAPIYSLAYHTACLYTGEQLREQDPNERLIVYGNTDFPVVNCKEVKENARLLKDKIVMLGTFTEEEDAHITPVGKMPGMKIQAYSILSYLQNKNIRQMSTGASLLLAFILCYLSAWIGYWIPRRFPLAGSYVSSAYYFILTALLVWVSFLCFIHYGYNVSLLYPLLGIALVETARGYYDSVIDLLRKRFGWKILSLSLYADNEV